jgi:uncharacterized membrane protein YbhN (UPF0104 family)
MAVSGKVMRKWMVRAAGSVVALGLIFWFLPLDALTDAFRRISPGLFAGTVVVFCVAHVAAATKWWWLMDRPIPFGTALRAHFAGLAANLCLPGAAGGDAVRAAVAHISMRDGARVTAGAVGDRMIDLVALAILTLTGILLLGGNGGNPALAISVAAAVFAVFALGLYLLPPLGRAFWTRHPHLPARALVLRLSDAFAALARQPGRLLGALVMSTAIQAVLIWLSIRLAEAVGVHLPVAAWLFAWPLAKIVATLPVSLGGLGVRESSLAALLVPFGASAAPVVASGLVWQAVLWLTGLLGALLLMISGDGLFPRTPATKEVAE